MTNVAFGIPQILSSFLMIIICCLTDCAAAITLAYEKPEADVLLRPPRNPRKDRLVDTKLIFHAYFFVGLIQCFLSFTMAFWYMERQGVPFTAMWLKFGEYDPQYDTDYINETANKASSIYFVTLVVMQLFNLLAMRTRRLSIFQQPPIFNKATQVCYSSHKPRMYANDPRTISFSPVCCSLSLLFSSSVIFHRCRTLSPLAKSLLSIGSSQPRSVLVSSCSTRQESTACARGPMASLPR